MASAARKPVVTVTGPCAWCSRPTTNIVDGDFACANGFGCTLPVKTVPLAANDRSTVSSGEKRGRGRIPGSTNTHVTVNGTAMSVTAWAEYFDISHGRLKRLIGNGDPAIVIAELILKPPKPVGESVMVEIDGETLSIHEWAARVPTSVAVLRSGACVRGHSIAMEIRRRLAAPKRVTVSDDEPITYEGETKTLAQWARWLHTEPPAIRTSMFKLGLSVHEELARRFNIRGNYEADKNRLFTVAGTQRTFEQWATRIGAKSIGTIRNNARHHGRSIEQEIERRLNIKQQLRVRR